MISTTVNLFKVNWFATGNKCSWDKSFEMLKGKQQFKFKVVLNSDERSGEEAKQKDSKLEFLLKRENLIILRLKIT